MTKCKNSSWSLPPGSSVFNHSPAIVKYKKGIRELSFDKPLLF